MRRAIYSGLVCGFGLLSSVQAAPYVFHEDFSAPPLTPGTPGAADWTDGWNNGDHGWEVSEGVGNVFNNYYFSQRSDGPYFTGGAPNVGVLRTDGVAAVAAAFQDLPTDQNYVSGNVTFKVQNMIGSWGSYNKFALVGDGGYATQLIFGNPTGTDDRIYVSQYSGTEAVVTDASTLTTDGKVLQWNTAGFNPNAGNYATVSVGFDLTTITVTVSTTDATGLTSSALPVSFPVNVLDPAYPFTKITRAGFFLHQSPNSNGLVYMSDFLLTANPEAAVVNATWNADADGNWSDAGKWLGGVPNNAGAIANFGTIITSAHTVTVDAPQTVGQMNLSSPFTYTLSGSSTITLDGGTGATAINVTDGSHVIDAPIVLAKDTTVSVSGGGDLSVQHVRGAGLSVNGGAMKITAKGTANDPTGTSVVTALSVGSGASLDLTNNSMIVDYTTVGTLVDDTRLMLQSGKLTSSSTGGKIGYGDNAILAKGSFAGQTPDSTSLLIKFTYGGDANLDGQVDISDLGALATAWQTSAPWTGGDFDYSGFVDISDLGLLATNWQLGVGSPLGPSFDEALASVGLAGVSVPEPTALGLLGLCLAGVASRRIRREAAATAKGA